jgi:hypothetical protein
MINKTSTSTWSAKIEFTLTPEYPNECHTAYASGGTVEDLRSDLTRVMDELKGAGRTPTKFVVSKTTKTTWTSNEQFFKEVYPE